MNDLSSQTHEGGDSVVVEILNELKLPPNQIRRVPSHLKDEETHRNVFDPVVVSMGPYHHGKPNLCRAEFFKQKCLDIFVAESGSYKDGLYFYGKIIEKIDEIRGWYEEITEYDNQELAWLMLRDASFFIFYMNMFAKNNKYYAFSDYFGITTLSFIDRDLLLLENQIPFWIIKLLICLQSNEESFGEGEFMWTNLIRELTTRQFSAYAKCLETLPWANSVHYLDASRCKLIFEIPPPPPPPLSNMDANHTRRNSVGKFTYRFRSIANLKAKGISFKLIETNKGPQVISFTSSSLYGELQLPRLIITTSFFVKYSNLIAYEMSPTTDTNFFVSSLINFIKSLIESHEDVRILREEGILFNDIGSDDEVVKGFKDLNTYGIDDSDVFSELRKSIERHCRSKNKTWKAELIHAYFRSPWTVIALLAAFCLLCLTVVQTFFTISPAN